MCNRCFETWLLGCKGLYPKTPVEENSYFYQYYNHYNIEMCDPEKMTVPEWARETTGKISFHYLHELLRYNKIRYSKNKSVIFAQMNILMGLLKG